MSFQRSCRENGHSRSRLPVSWQTSPRDEVAKSNARCADHSAAVGELTHEAAMACQCESCQEAKTMSKRTVRDYLHSAFFARDKATLAAIVKDAEAAVPDEEAAPENDDDSKGKH